MLAKPPWLRSSLTRYRALLVRRLINFSRPAYTGAHDVAVFKALATQVAALVPRYDKTTDDRLSRKWDVALADTRIF
jgi:hypothetical protein